METVGMTSGNLPANDIGNPPTDVATYMKEKLERVSFRSTKRCIYRAPKRLREINEKAFTPRVVSIGPFHHGKDGLEEMEEHKWRYLKKFLQWTSKSLEDTVEFIKEREALVRHFYAEAIRVDHNKFVEMILLDATFIVVFLLRGHFSDFRLETDRDFGIEWLSSDIALDILLIENQLPFFVLVDLFDIARITIAPHLHWPSIIEISIEYFSFLVFVDSNAEVVPTPSPNIKHFVDLLNVCYVPVKPNPVPTRQKRCDLSHSVTDLHEAGVQFKVSSGKGLLDINFRNGVMEIPLIKVGDQTETIFRNLLTFEQCHYAQERFVTDFVVLMDSLVNTPRDVELLIEYGIIENWLGSNLEVSTLLNSLTKELRFAPKRFYFHSLCEDLNEYCKVPWHKWKATLNQDYFKTPWAILSIVAATILLILTFIQTTCAVTKCN